MKKINLKSVYKPTTAPGYAPQKLYKICLGNGKIINYTSVKAARADLAKINRQLNVWLCDMNEIYISIFTQYRRAWFYYYDAQTKTNNSANENKLKDCLDFINECLNRSVTNTSGVNGQALAWNFFNKAIRESLNACSELDKLYKRRSMNAERLFIAAMVDRINYLKLSLENLSPGLKVGGRNTD